ncbi:MAG: Putative enoyl CoA hydratase [Alectoria sarmentosa]|nr:MAG: Putative enoyl CoA hydratase [Alectoria sarmentosa]
MADHEAPPLCKYLNLTYPLPFVAHVEINRPEKMNAFKQEMWQEFPPLFSYLSTSPSTRAIILSGAGPKAFTAGLDVQEASQDSPLSPNSSHSALDGARTATTLRRHIDAFQACITSVEKCEKPIVAAIHGWCLGLGIDISVCCDVRICAKDTRFSVKEVDIGLAADIGTLSRLPKVVRSGSWVKDVCLSARLFGAEEAEKVGFVSWVGSSGGKEEVVKEALRWAELVAGKSPVAVQGTKEILNWSWNRSVEDGLRYTGVWNSAMLQSEDTKEAMMSGISKKKPKFAKL